LQLFLPSMDVLWLVFAGGVAGAMNAMVGGGSFVTLPALVATGLSALEANATSSVALYPGGALSAFVYRGTAGSVRGVPLTQLILLSIVGGCAGAALLLWTPTRVFDRVLPWLLLTATLALAFGPRLVRLNEMSVQHGRRSVLSIQLLLAIYGGYFGGAVGLLMIAAWRVLGEHDIKSLHGPRTLLVTAANTAAIALLVAAGIVRWTACVPMAAGAMAGGYIGARVGRRLSPRVAHVTAIVISVSITIAFFIRAHRS
jgi:uncharacterized membrane protein YfcA